MAAVLKEPRDERAWRTLHAVAGPGLRRVVARVLGQGRESDYDDALALTWERLLLHLTGDIEQKRLDAPWSYLTMVARNTAIDLLRKRSVRPPAEGVIISGTDERGSADQGTILPARAEDPLDELIADNLRSYLEEKIGAREWAIISYTAEGYSSGEIAERLTAGGMPTTDAAVRQAKKRALVHIAAVLSAQGDWIQRQGKSPVTKRSRHPSE